MCYDFPMHTGRFAIRPPRWLVLGLGLLGALGLAASPAGATGQGEWVVAVTPEYAAQQGR